MKPWQIPSRHERILVQTCEKCAMYFTFKKGKIHLENNFQYKLIQLNYHRIGFMRIKKWHISKHNLAIYMVKTPFRNPQTAHCSLQNIVETFQCYFSILCINATVEQLISSPFEKSIPKLWDYYAQKKFLESI